MICSLRDRGKSHYGVLRNVREIPTSRSSYLFVGPPNSIFSIPFSDMFAMLFLSYLVYIRAYWQLP